MVDTHFEKLLEVWRESKRYTPNPVWNPPEVTFIGEHYVLENPKWDPDIELDFAPPIVLEEGMINVNNVARALFKEKKLGKGPCVFCRDPDCGFYSV